MLILNKGKKDYYDYLAGVYGIDKDIVFDRTEFTVLSHINHFTSVDLSFFFDPERISIFASSHNDCLRHPHGWAKEVYGRKKPKNGGKRNERDLNETIIRSRCSLWTSDKKMEP